MLKHIELIVSESTIHFSSGLSVDPWRGVRHVEDSTVILRVSTDFVQATKAYFLAVNLLRISVLHGDLVLEVSDCCLLFLTLPG